MAGRSYLPLPLFPEAALCQQMRDDPQQQERLDNTLIVGFCFLGIPIALLIASRFTSAVIADVASSAKFNLSTLRRT